MSFLNNNDHGASSGAVRNASRQRQLLSENVRIEEELLPAFVKPILWISVLLVVAFIAWASFTPMKEVARGLGEVIPSSKIKVVQHLDGGVVAQILVEERQLVQEGDLVIRMDGAQTLAEVNQTEARLATLKLREARLVAFTEGREPWFLFPFKWRKEEIDLWQQLEADLASDLADISRKYPDQVQIQHDIYCKQIDTRDSTLSILDKQIQQREQRLEQLRKALSVAYQHLGLTSELASMREDLAERKLINRSVLLETRRAKVTASGEVSRLMEEILVSTRELEESRNRRMDTANQIQHDALAELGTVRAEKAEVEETLGRLHGRFGRLEVRAPNRGYVQDLKVQTIGQVVQPGGLLMQIVPDDAPLEAEVRVAPKDIGFMREGQPVKLRVSSYDYSRFGYANGRLKRVSAFSLVDESGNPYFKAWVVLDNPYVGNNPGQYLLQPGMAVEAEVVLGEKTFLAYMTKPVVDVVTRAFHEK